MMYYEFVFIYTLAFRVVFTAALEASEASEESEAIKASEESKATEASEKSDAMKVSEALEA